MRRVTITMSAALVLLVFAPGSAVAHGGHHRRHHHARHTRIERFGDVSGAPTDTPSSADNAGMVQSFDNGVLTIMLNDHSLVSGSVTNDTEIECMAPEGSTAVHEDGDGGGDQSGDGDQNANGDDQAQNMDGQGAGEDQGEAAEPNEDQAEEQNENENEAGNNCSTANLTPGAVVREAELRISSAGSVWNKVELGS